MRSTGTVTAIIIAGMNGLSAAAQTAPANPATTAAVDAGDLGGDIIVTAQKRKEKIQDVGIAITAFSGAQLRALNIVDSRAISTLSPGVYLGGSLGGQNSQYTIRGVTQNDFNDIVEAPNAVYLDEGYIALGQGQTFALFDIERVEILKGPQGTLFGRNATGGLVHFVTTQPSLTEQSGFVDVRGGVFDSRGAPGTFRGEAALNLPLSDKIAMRAAVMWNKIGPYIRNEYPAFASGGSPGRTAGANVGAEDTLAGRLTTLFAPADGVKFTLAANAARSINSTPPYQEKSTIGVFNAAGELVNVINTPATETRASIGPNGADVGTDLNNDGVFGDSFGRPVAGGDFFGYIDPDGKGPLTSSDFAFSRLNKVRTYGVDLVAEIELNSAVTLTSVSDFKHYYKILFTEVEGGPANQSANYAGVKADQITQELRLNGTAKDLEWVAGLYYLHIDNKAINGLKFPVNGLVPGAPFDLSSNAHLRTDSYSAFGQVAWNFAPRLTLVLGGRIIREEKDFQYTQGLYFTADSREVEVGPRTIIGPVFGPDGPEPYFDKRGQTLWAGKAQVEFRPTSDLMIYAGINRGVKAGSYNAAIPGGLPVPLSAIPYKAEVLLSYEGGFKYVLPDGRSHFNASAFYYDYKNYQSFLFTGVAGVVINADDTTYGVEADFFTSPFEGLDFSLTGSYFNATVKDVPLRVDGPIVRDVRPTYAPSYQATAILRYGWDGLGGRLSIGGDASYTSSIYYNLRNFDADKFGGYVMVNASLTYTKGPYQITGGVKNLTNVRAGLQGFDLAVFSGGNSVAYKPPRLFELGARYSF